MSSDAHRARDWDQLLSWLVVAMVCAVSAWFRFRFLTGFDTPVGIDGYYYPIQIRALQETGSLYYPSAPAVPWLMWAAASLSDPITAAKLVAAVATAAVGLPIMALCRRLEMSSWPAATSAVMATTAGSGLYMAAEFAKSGIALTIAATALWALAQALAKPKWWPVAVLLAMATLLAHKLATALLLIMGIALIWRALASSKRAQLASAGALGAVIVVGLLAPTQFLSVTSLGPIADMWTWPPRWSMAIYDPGGQPLHVGGDILLSAVFGIAALCVDRRPIIWACAAVAVLAALPIIDVADTNGLGPRLRLIAFVPGAVCAGAVLHWAHTNCSWLSRWAVIGIAVALAVARPRVPQDGVVVPHPDMLEALTQLPQVFQGPDAVLVIPDRQLVFASVWLHRTETRMRPVAQPPGRQIRLLPAWFTSPALTERLMSFRSDPPPGVAPPVAVLASSPLTLFAVPEATWTVLLSQLPDDQAAHYRRWPTP